MRPGFNPKGNKLKTDGSTDVNRGFIAHLVIAAADAVAASANGVHAAIALTEEAQEIITEITSPAVPRALQIKGNQAGVAGDVVIEGTNYADETITETIAANGATAVDGTEAFKTITKITVPALAGAGDTISVGWNDKLGLPYKLAHNTVLATYLDNTKEATAPTVTVDADAIENNTIDLNSALSGKVVDVYFIV